MHGRAQGGKDPIQLERIWVDALRSGFAAAGLGWPEDVVEVHFPFYGVVLDRATAASPSEGHPVQRGFETAPDRFQLALLCEIAERVGLSESEIAAALDDGREAVERGAQHWPPTRALMRGVTRRAPWLSEAGLRWFFADVDAYLNRPAARHAVHEVVAPAVCEHGGDDVVVVAHSLGSVVAYDVLTAAAADVRVPLLVTLGSPLGIRAIQDRLPRPLGRPTGVLRWFNAADERDPIALHARLDRDTFPALIENVSDVHNPRKDPHSIVGYLGDEAVVRVLADVLGG